MSDQESAPAIPLQAVPSPTVPNEAVPAPAVPSEAVPAPAVPSEAVPSVAVPAAAEPSEAVAARARPLDAHDEGPLLGDMRELRAGWQRIKAGFVDDPRGAVSQAAGVVDEVAQRLIAAVRDRRRQIRETLDGDSAADDTETLRIALLRYQALFRQLGGDETAGH